MNTLVRFLMVVFVLSAFSEAAFAQQAPGYGPGTDPRKALAPENFPDMKARVLQMLDQRRSRIDQEKACVDKAENSEELKKCRPAPQMRGSGPRRQGDSVPAPAERQ